MWFSLQVLAKGDATLEVDHALIDCDLLVGCEGGLKHWTEAIKQGLDLAALGGAIWISHVQHPEDLEEPISGEDRAEEGEVGSVICAPVMLQVSELHYHHVEHHSDETLHLLHCYRSPVPVE